MAIKQGSVRLRLVRAAAALNFKDVMLAYGKLNRDLMAAGFSRGALGFEFAGTVAGERRVMGVAHQAIATSCGAPKFLVRCSWPLNPKS